MLLSGFRGLRRREVEPKARGGRLCVLYCSLAGRMCFFNVGALRCRIGYRKKNMSCRLLVHVLSM